jgi:hypothetical protein
MAIPLIHFKVPFSGLDKGRNWDSPGIIVMVIIGSFSSGGSWRLTGNPFPHKGSI